MPKRSERFFWIRAEDVNPEFTRAIDSAIREFAQSQKVCSTDVAMCTAPEASTKQLWLLRAQMAEQQLASTYVKALKDYVGSFQEKFGIPKLKRIPNLPTPLLTERLTSHFRTDIGLHVVNDDFNGMLVTYTYSEGRSGFHNPPHLQLDGVRFNRCRCNSGNRQRSGNSSQIRDSLHMSRSRSTLTW